MKKNTLIVFIVILTPIVILGALAMAGAENFAKEKDAVESEHGNETTESAASVKVLTSGSIFDVPVSLALQSTDLMALA